METKKTSGSTIKSKKISEYAKTNKNDSTTLQDLWDAAKAFVREKLIVIQAFLKKQEKSQNNISYHLNKLVKG